MQLLQKVSIYEKGIKKVALQKKSVMRNIAFLKKQLFAKSCFFEKVGAVQKNVLRKSSSTVDIFRISYSQDLVARQKFHSEKVAILKKKNAEKTWLFRKRTSSKKAAALKKELLQKYDSCVTLKKVILKKCKEVAFPKIKLSENIATYAKREIAILMGNLI